jgi:hypothetical protein
MAGVELPLALREGAIMPGTAAIAAMPPLAK